MQRCEFRDSGECYRDSRIKPLNRALLESACYRSDREEDCSREVRQFVLPLIPEGEIHSAVESDWLILRFCELLVKKFGKETSPDIGPRMVHFGKLVLLLQQTGGTTKGLDSFISGHSFDKVTEAAETLFKMVISDDNSDTVKAQAFKFKTLALSLRLGYPLAMVANVKRGWALQCRNKHSLGDAEVFLSRLQSEQSDTSAPSPPVSRLQSEQSDTSTPSPPVSRLQSEQSDTSAPSPPVTREISPQTSKPAETKPESEGASASKSTSKANVMCGTGRSEGEKLNTMDEMSTCTAISPAGTNSDCEAATSNETDTETVTPQNGKTHGTLPKNSFDKDISCVSLAEKNKVRKRAKCERNKWTPLQLSTLTNLFSDSLRGNFYPMGRSLKEAINRFPCLKDRTVVQVRSKQQLLKRAMSDV